MFSRNIGRWTTDLDSTDPARAVVKGREIAAAWLLALLVVGIAGLPGLLTLAHS